MQKYLVAFCMLIVAGLAPAEFTSAQDSQDAEESLLPDIDPQDIEIRTQYRARFPGLRRQPILGFTPGSRVFQVDPDRIPFFEDHEETAAQLPVGQLSRPAAPDYTFFPYADRSGGYGRVGIGSFISPEAEFYLNREVADKQWISGGLDYSSGNGHLEQRSSFRKSDFHVGYFGSVGDRSVLDVGLGGTSDFNYMVLPEGLDPTENPGKKTYNEYSAHTKFTRYRSAVDYFEAGVDGSVSTVHLQEESFQLTDELNNWTGSGHLGYSWAGSRTGERFSVRTDLQGGGYESDTGMDQFWHIAELSGSYDRLYNYQTRVGLTLGVAHGSDIEESSQIQFTPDFRLEHTFSDYIGLSASLTGSLNQSGHGELHRKNRFLLPANNLRNRYELTASTELLIEPISGNQIRLGTEYRSVKGYSWFERQSLDTGTSVVPGHYAVAYGDVTVPKAYAGIGVDLVRERVWFDVEGYMQTPRISDEEKVPYEEEYGLSGALTIRPVDILHFEVWGSFIGPRNTPDGEDLSAFLDLGSKLELRITENIGIYGKIANLLNQEYQIWQGYTERPFQAFGGITLHF